MAKLFAAHRPKPKVRRLSGIPEPRAQTKAQASEAAKFRDKPKEIGGPSGPEPTRYGDWERKGICVDF